MTNSTSPHSPRSPRDPQGHVTVWGALCAMGIVLLAAAAGLVAVFFVVFPAAALLVRFFLPEWVFISPVLNQISISWLGGAICVGGLVAGLLLLIAQRLGRLPALQALRRR